MLIAKRKDFYKLYFRKNRIVHIYVSSCWMRLDKVQMTSLDFMVLLNLSNKAYLSYLKKLNCNLDVQSNSFKRQVLKYNPSDQPCILISLHHLVREKPNCLIECFLFTLLWKKKQSSKWPLLLMYFNCRHKNRYWTIFTKTVL